MIRCVECWLDDPANCIARLSMNSRSTIVPMHIRCVLSDRRIRARLLTEKDSVIILSSLTSRGYARPYNEENK